MLTRLRLLLQGTLFLVGFLAHGEAIPCDRIMFVTKSTYTGSMQGLAGANNRCHDQALFSVHPLIRERLSAKSTFEAFISDHKTAISDVYKTSNESICRVDGALLAPSLSNLLNDGTLLAPINVDQDGDVLSEMNSTVHTGSHCDGTSSIAWVYRCNSWRASSVPYTGETGDPHSYGDMDKCTWLSATSTKCMERSHLYCIEVPLERQCRVVFATSVKFQGNLGDPEAANGKCDDLALKSTKDDIKRLATTVGFAAWLSYTHSAALDATQFDWNTCIKNAAHHLIADDADDMKQYDLYEAMRYDEFGGIIALNEHDVWTGTRTRHGDLGQLTNCHNWSTAENFVFGQAGRATAISNLWSNAKKELDCANVARLYCFSKRSPFLPPPITLPTKSTQTTTMLTAETTTTTTQPTITTTQPATITKTGTTTSSSPPNTDHTLTFVGLGSICFLTIAISTMIVLYRCHGKQNRPHVERTRSRSKRNSVARSMPTPKSDVSMSNMSRATTRSKRSSKRMSRNVYGLVPHGSSVGTSMSGDANNIYDVGTLAPTVTGQHVYHVAPSISTTQSVQDHTYVAVHDLQHTEHDYDLAPDV